VQPILTIARRSAMLTRRRFCLVGVGSAAAICGGSIFGNDALAVEKFEVKHTDAESNPGVCAFPVIGTPTRASDRSSGDARKPAAVIVDCSMHQAPRSHLFPYAVKM
jgi:hypothetical protein